MMNPPRPSAGNFCHLAAPLAGTGFGYAIAQKRPAWIAGPFDERFPSRKRRGFTVLELLVATAIFIIMVILLVSIISHVNTAWQQTDAQKTRRQNARVVFDAICRDLQGAVPALPGQGTNPVVFQLISGFARPGSQALFWGTALPVNRTKSDLSTVGYFVSADNKLYRCYTNAAVSDLASLTNSVGGTNYTGLLAENILGLTASVINSDGTSTTNTASYTTNLPVAVDLVLALSDARTLLQHPNLSATNLSSPPAGVQVFRTRIDLPSAP